ncbi:MAG: prenyltransferase [Spirochaetes bacterium]|nr:prenyltransferase [Spirochaetota bacterium]
MKESKPSLLQMTRAPFLSSIIAPLLTGTLLCIKINGSVNVSGFVLALISGITLHAATNVYNDIYDTIQGTDKVNEHRNEFSGGSGVLQDSPELMNQMYFIARTALIIAFFSTAALMFFIDKKLWIYLWSLFVISAFFSKYYTAAPVKLAYRGLGEISVWFSFGPMAVTMASVAQNTGVNTEILLLMPLSGLSTLSILLVGQMIDIDADRKSGKHGIISRTGTRFSSLLYAAVQSAVILNVLSIYYFFGHSSFPVLLSLIPYVILLPGTIISIVKNHDNVEKLKQVAKKTVLMHMLFSLFLIIGLIIYL